MVRAVAQIRQKNVFRATVLKTLGRVCLVFLRIETSIIKTPTKKTVFSKKKV